MAVTTEDIYFVLDRIRGRRWKEDLPDVDCWTIYQYATIKQEFLGEIPAKIVAKRRKLIIVAPAKARCGF